MPLLSTRHCERAVAKRRGCEGCQVTTAVPTASVSVEIDREERTCRARGACGFATRNDVWREAVGSERPRLREIPYQIAEAPAALAFGLPAVIYSPGSTLVRIAAATSWRVYDGLQRGTWLGRWGPVVLNGTPTECGRGACMPGRRLAVQW